MSEQQSEKPARQVIGYQVPISITPIKPDEMAGYLPGLELPAAEGGPGGKGSGGAMIQRGRLVIDTGGEGSGVSQQEETGIETGYGAGQGWFSLGYALVDSNRLRLYPLVGVGGLGLGVDAQRLVSKTDPVYVQGAGDQPEAEYERVQLGAGGVFGLLGLGADVRLRFKRLTFMFGVRAGFMVMPFRMAYTGDNQPKHLDLPTSGPFLRVVFGFGFGKKEADQG